MLEINIPSQELYDEEKECFSTQLGGTLVLEHSLLSLEKWEMKWKKPFLFSIERKQISQEELLDYIKCMTINKVNPKIYTMLTYENIQDIINYMNDSMTATTIGKRAKRSNRRVPIYTNEVIYAYMIEAGIPFECAKWHINRLLMLLQVCSELGNTSKKTKKELLQEYSSLNAARRAKLGTNG